MPPPGAIWRKAAADRGFSCTLVGTSVGENHGPAERCCGAMAETLSGISRIMDTLFDRPECAHLLCGQARFASDSPWCVDHALVAIANNWPKFDEWHPALRWTRDNVPHLTEEDVGRRERDRLARGA